MRPIGLTIPLSDPAICKLDENGRLSKAVWVSGMTRSSPGFSHSPLPLGVPHTDIRATRPYTRRTGWPSILKRLGERSSSLENWKSLFPFLNVTLSMVSYLSCKVLKWPMELNEVSDLVTGRAIYSIEKTKISGSLKMILPPWKSRPYFIRFCLDSRVFNVTWIVCPTMETASTFSMTLGSIKHLINSSSRPWSLSWDRWKERCCGMRFRRPVYFEIRLIFVFGIVTYLLG